MTNLKKYYPNAKLKDFRVGSSMLAYNPDGSNELIDCDECHARKFCRNIKLSNVNKSCIDTFEAFMRKRVK